MFVCLREIKLYSVNEAKCYWFFLRYDALAVILNDAAPWLQDVQWPSILYFCLVTFLNEWWIFWWHKVARYFWLTLTPTSRMFQLWDSQAYVYINTKIQDYIHSCNKWGRVLLTVKNGENFKKYIGSFELVQRGEIYQY